MKISVIMPSYNQVDFIEKSIQSVVNQNYPDLEFILMDGGSTDGSLELIKKYSQHFSHWQSEKDDGQSAAINAGMARATGAICCWLNSDDLLAPRALEKVEKFFNSNPDEEWLIGHGVFQEADGKLIQNKNPNGTSFEDFVDWQNNGINQPSVFWRKELWEKVNGLDGRLNFVMDYDLWLKFAQVKPAAKLDDILGITVFHDDMKTQVNNAEMYVEHALVLAKHNCIEEGFNHIVRPVKRAFELDHKLSFITKNRFYRKWRDKNV